MPDPTSYLRDQIGSGNPPSVIGVGLPVLGVPGGMAGGAAAGFGSAAGMFSAAPGVGAAGPSAVAGGGDAAGAVQGFLAALKQATAQLQQMGGGGGFGAAGGPPGGSPGGGMFADWRAGQRGAMNDFFSNLHGGGGPKGVSSENFWNSGQGGETGMGGLARMGGMGAGFAALGSGVMNAVRTPNSFGEQQAGYSGYDQLMKQYNPAYGLTMGAFGNGGDRDMDYAGRKEMSHLGYNRDAAARDPNDWAGVIRAESGMRRQDKVNELRGAGLSEDSYNTELAQFDRNNKANEAWQLKTRQNQIDTNIDRSRTGSAMAMANYDSERISLQAGLERRTVASSTSMTDEEKKSELQRIGVSETMGIAKLGRGVSGSSANEAAIGPEMQSGDALEKLADKMEPLANLAQTLADLTATLKTMREANRGRYGSMGGA